MCCRELRKKERLEREMKELKSALEARQADIKAKSAAATQAEEQVQRLEQSLKESQVRLILSHCQACSVQCQCCIGHDAALRCPGWAQT